MKGDVFDLRRLRYFAAIAAAGSLSAAARKLNVAQPALTHQIGELERCLGRPVFTRTSRGIELTPVGRLLLDHTDTILRDVEVADAALKQFGSEAPFPSSIRLSLTPSVYDITSMLVTRFNAEFPNTRLTVSEDRFAYCYELIRSGKLDLAVTMDDPDWPGAISLTWETLYLVSLASGTREQARSVDFADLAAERNLIVPGVGGPLRAMLDEIAARTGIVLSIAQELQGVAARKQAVLDGLGTALLPWRNIAREAQSGVFHARRIINPLLRRQLVMRFKPDIHPGFLKRCCEMMRRLLDEVEDEAFQPVQPPRVARQSHSDR